MAEYAEGLAAMQLMHKKKVADWVKSKATELYGALVSIKMDRATMELLGDSILRKKPFADLSNIQKLAVCRAAFLAYSEYYEREVGDSAQLIMSEDSGS